MKTSFLVAMSAVAMTAAGVGVGIAQESTAPKANATTTEMPKAAAPAMAGTYATAQTATDWRSSKLVGLNVYNAKNEKIGDINDLIIDAKGAVTHAIVGVGGFLGMGEKNVAIEFSSLKMSRGKDGKPSAMVDTTKEALSAAPIYKFYSAS